MPGVSETEYILSFACFIASHFPFSKHPKTELKERNKWKELSYPPHQNKKKKIGRNFPIKIQVKNISL
jgi:hypothetical protein